MVYCDKERKKRLARMEAWRQCLATAHCVPAALRFREDLRFPGYCRLRGAGRLSELFNLLFL